MEYFLVDTKMKVISGITSSLQSVIWTKPHVYVPTRGIDPTNAKIETDGLNYWAEPIDPIGDLPEITQCLPGRLQ